MEHFIPMFHFQHSQSVQHSSVSLFPQFSINGTENTGWSRCRAKNKCIKCYDSAVKKKIAKPPAFCDVYVAGKENDVKYSTVSNMKL